MAWTNTYAVHTWANGEYLEENFLNQGTESTEYLREQVSIVPLVVNTQTILTSESGASPSSSGTVDLHLTVDGTTELINTSVVTNNLVMTGASSVNKDVSGLAKGVHAIHEGTGTELFKFICGNEIEYISVFARAMWQNKYNGKYNTWGDFDPNGEYLITKTINWSIFGHRVSQSW